MSEGKRVPVSLRAEADAPGSGGGDRALGRFADQLLDALARCRVAVNGVPAGGMRDELDADRVVGTLEDGALRDELTDRRADLPGLLDRARWLTEKGAALDPLGPVRDPRLLALLKDDPLGDQSTQLADRPPTILLAERVIELRDELWRAAEEAARLAVKTRENALATDVAGWLSALASGVASAREASWISAAYREGINLSDRAERAIKHE